MDLNETLNQNPIIPKSEKLVFPVDFLNGVSGGTKPDLNADFRSDRPNTFIVQQEPKAVDGLMWAANNQADKKVLWAYLGGDTTNRQQISASRMETSFSFDYTSDQTITISTWFQPRVVIFNGFTENTSSGLYGITNGQAGKVSPIKGICNSMLLTLSTFSNFVSDLSISTTLYNNVAIDADHDGVIDGWANIVGVNSASWVNNNYYSFTAIATSIINDAIGTSSVSKETYIYVDSWSDTGVVLKLVCPSGWRMAGSLIVIG